MVRRVQYYQANTKMNDKFAVALGNSDLLP